MSGRKLVSAADDFPSQIGMNTTRHLKVKIGWRQRNVSGTPTIHTNVGSAALYVFWL